MSVCVNTLTVFIIMLRVSLSLSTRFCSPLVVLVVFSLCSLSSLFSQYVLYHQLLYFAHVLHSFQIYQRNLPITYLVFLASFSTSLSGHLIFLPILHLQFFPNDWLKDTSLQALIQTNLKTAVSKHWPRPTSRHQSPSTGPDQPQDTSLQALAQTNLKTPVSKHWPRPTSRHQSPSIGPDQPQDTSLQALTQTNLKTPVSKHWPRPTSRHQSPSTGPDQPQDTSLQALAQTNLKTPVSKH